MRPLAVILVWVVILGGLAIYMQARRYLAPPPEQVYSIQPAPGEFTLEVTPTFDAQGGVDEFALDPVEQPAFVLSLRDEEIVRYDQTAHAGLPIQVRWDTDAMPLEIGKNEFHIRMTTPTGETDKVHGVRLRLLRDGAEVDSHTLWCEPGRPVDGVFPIQLTGGRKESQHAHNGSELPDENE